MALFFPFVFGERLVGDGLHLDEQMRVRQLMDGDGGARRTVFSEVLVVNLVVTGEVVHVHQVGGNLDEVAQIRANAGENVAYIVNDGAGLRANIELRRAKRISLGTGDGIVRAAGTSAGDEKKIAGAFNVRKFAARLCFARNDFAFHNHQSLNLTQILFSSE